MAEETREATVAPVTTEDREQGVAAEGEAVTTTTTGEGIKITNIAGLTKINVPEEGPANTVEVPGNPPRK